MADSDCVMVMGSNMAENHPVAFRWPMKAKVNGATLIHVDPRFTRTSAMADIYAPIRAGSDIAFLGGLVRYVLENGREFRDYVVPYTNAATILREDFRDTEDLDGLFGGWDRDKGQYDIDSWQYEGVEVAPAAGQREMFSGEAKSERGTQIGDEVLELARLVAAEREAAVDVVALRPQLRAAEVRGQPLEPVHRRGPEEPRP